jgi:photosystem II stability/assembly factor-like uncharacterized protein
MGGSEAKNRSVPVPAIINPQCAAFRVNLAIDFPLRGSFMSIRRLLCCVVLSAAFNAAAAVDPALFQELHWRLLGPFRGGRVLAVTGVVGEPDHFYFGSVNGGVWETVDAGRTWQPLFDAQPIGSIGAIALAPSNQKVIYVGTGEADMRSDIAQGDGVYKSIDGGHSWSHIGLADSLQIGQIVVHPRNPDLVYVAALGHPYGPNAERGLFRSRDGGKSWQKILGRDDDTGAIDVALEPGNPDVIYAALWQTRRPPWNIYPPSNGAGSGLFKSVDGGDTWTEIRGHGLPRNPGRIGLAVAPSRPQRVYAIIDAEEGGIYRSDDAGATWNLASNDERIWARGWYFGGITVEPDNPDVVWSCNVNLFRSGDGGKTFAPVKGDPTGDDFHTLWIDPENPRRRMLGGDQGAVVSLNGGLTWSSWYNQPTGQFYTLSTDNRFPYWVYGSQQDSGAAGVPSRTNTTDGITLSQFKEITPGGESDNIAPDPRDPDIIYGGRVEKLDVRTQQTRSIDPTMAVPEHQRGTWTLPLVFSSRDPKVLYFGNQKIFRTEDGGEHWSVISPDLAREDPGTPANLDPATVAHNQQMGPRRGVVYTIAPSRLQDHDIWAGTDDGLIWRTRDEGAHWQNITPAAMTPWSKVGTLDTSHFDPQTAYAAIDRHRLDDYRATIYRTHDGGQQWQLIASGIPAGSFVNVVREDSFRKGLLYAGTEKGMYVSFDDGDHWQSFQMNLPVTSVRDIDVHGNDLVIGTHGRAFWVVDDVTPLRQAAQAAESGPFLFQPAEAFRERPAGFTGTPMPKDEALASNPPAGAYIDYLLPAAPNAAIVTLEILDAGGKLVRRYTSADPVPTPDPARLRTAPEWFSTPSILRTTPGMHRFVWPLRYAAPPSLAPPGQGSWADGIWVPPGSYHITLTVDGRSFTQPLVVAADPRVTLPPAAYAGQFVLAREIEPSHAAVAAALDEAVTLIKALIERRAGASGEIGKAMDSLRARAVEVSDVVPSKHSQGLWWLPPKKTTSLRFHDGALQTLATAVDGADGAPTPDAREGWRKLRPSADEAVRTWAQLKTRELAPLNDQLKAAGMPAIVLP